MTAVGSHADDAERHGGIKQTGIKQMGIFGLKPRHVPYIMAAHDCLEPLAIGMSAKCGPLVVTFTLGCSTTRQPTACFGL